MSFLDSLLDPLDRLITEHGSAAVLREHLGLIKAKLAEKETQHSALEAQCKDLQARLLQSESRARELQQQLDALRRGQHTGTCCDACGSLNIRRTGSRPNKTFGKLCGKDALFTCGDCGAETAVLINV